MSKAVLASSDPAGPRHVRATNRDRISLHRYSSLSLSRAGTRARSRGQLRGHRRGGRERGDARGVTGEGMGEGMGEGGWERRTAKGETQIRVIE